MAGAVVAGCAVVAAALLAGRFWAGGETRPAPAMLAVLPFLNLTGDPQQDYFADGMTEELIARLGSIDPAHLGVIARTTAMQYKGASKNVSQIARDLGVSYVLEGSVRRDAQRLRVTGQLIRSDNQTHLWAENYDGDAGDVLRLQSEVAKDIATAIRPLLAPALDRRPAPPRIVPEAHDAYLRGLQAWNLRTRAGSEQSIAEFARAVELDPSYAQAFAALARAYSLAPVFGGAGASGAMPRARAAALQAVRLDDSLAEAHATLAFVAAHYDYDWGAAGREFRRALALNPSDANTHLFYSNSYLSPLGRHDEAIEEMRTAIRLDPLSLPIAAFLGRTLVWARRYDQALAQLKQVEQLNPNFPIVQERLAHVYTYMGDYAAAISSETRARLLTGEAPQVVMAKEEALRNALRQRGPPGYWQTLLELSQSPDNPPEGYVNSYGLAIVLARLGDRDRALAQLQRAYEERQLALTETGVEPAFDGLRSDQRFGELLRRIGLSR
jgi:TolB-like protein